MKHFDKKAALNRSVLEMFQEFPCAFLTGSRAFGWDTPESDFDVCVRMEDKDRAFSMIEGLSKTYKNSEYYDSAKGSGIFVKMGKLDALVTINPIPLHPLDMLCWWLATREIAHIGSIDSSRLGAREYKHGAFEMLRGFYKSMIQYHGAEHVMTQLRRDQAVARAKGATNLPEPSPTPRDPLH